MKIAVGGMVLLSLAVSGCASLSFPEVKKFSFPKEAHMGDVTRPYTVIGQVKTKVDYSSMDPAHEEEDLCRNYFNKAAHDLVKRAKRHGADAVIDIRSVVFMEDGKRETYTNAQCADDGDEGQVLAEGIAIRWKPTPAPASVPRNP